MTTTTATTGTAAAGPLAGGAGGEPRPIIEARALRKTYRLGRVDVPVLRGVDLTVREGECVAVLGASGSGKSTLLHVLGGLDRPDRAGGEVVYAGRMLSGFAPAELDRYRNRDVGFVFQFYHLLPELNIVQNTLLGAMIRRGGGGAMREARARAADLLGRFGLGGRLRHRPAELSGGERQRVAIARALINTPRLLLADEPTGNLDRATGELILDALMGVRDELGQSMVVVTHDDATAARADRVVHLRDGLVVGDGDAAAPASDLDQYSSTS